MMDMGATPFSERFSADSAVFRAENASPPFADGVGAA
jgi:hypothetical protein